MTIIRMWAGLGNQMFIYAYYRALQEQGIDAKLDLSYYEQFGSVQHGYGYLLPEIFPKTKNVYASKKECGNLAIYGMDPVSRAFRKIGINKITYLSQTKEYNSFTFNKELLNVDNKYVEGYFQSEQYFKSIENIIRDEFTMKIDESLVQGYIDQMQETNSVALHIRRGDYVSSDNENLLLCNSRYYDNAIKFIKEKIDNLRLFVFSDDVEWCKKKFANINDIEVVYVTGSPAPQHDMYLMSQCKHNIIANSSFSWWGAWLNNNKDKIVICPDVWQDKETFNSVGICPDEWIKLSRN